MAEKADRFQVAQAERFRPYPQYRDSGLDWLGEIPAHWEVKKWRYCCHVTEGQIAPDDEQFRERVLIAPNHIESGTGRLLHLETAREQGAISGKYLVGPGDIVYSKIRPALNKVCIATGDWLCSADMYPVSITESRLQTKFLLYFMLSAPYVQLMVDQSMRVAMPKVNRDKLAACPLLVPDPAEQRAIADFLDRETAKIDALVAKKKRLIELLQEKRTALITRAVTRGLDPNVATKDSGVEWLGEIPAHWEVKKFKRLCLVRRGASPRPIDDPIYFDDDGEYAWVRIADVTASERYLEGTTQKLSGLGRSKSVGLEPGELFLSIAATVGKPIVTRIKCCIHDGFVYFVGLRENKEYMYYLFSCGEAYKGLGKLGTQLNLNTDTIGDIYVPVPRREEQEAIVRFLDRGTATVDELIARIRHAIDLLAELRTALISAAVTGNIDVREAAPR